MTKEYCEVTTCAAASKRTRSGRLTQRTLDSVARHLRAMRQVHSRTQVYAVTAVFPTRLPASGGVALHACGMGFKSRNEVPGRGGYQGENRIFCHFRLNQTSMAQLGHDLGVTDDTEHDFLDHSPLSLQAGIYKRAALRPVSPGHVSSFRDRLSATEAHYSKFLTTPASFINEGEIECPSPDVTSIPIGFPCTAEVTVSINGKEQFHQFLTESDRLKAMVTIFDDRSTRDGQSTPHDFKSKLGRSKADTYDAGEQQDLHIIRDLTIDTYTGIETGHQPFTPEVVGQI